ncbi:hypothetical protein PR202_ga09389 [Eleusine coracana subsp. coracana]|uniref:Uncharacterized protein n=1 Tax=Eleusine coracana subsp. coracana TaxID=191504 RepID=A0AAV5C4V2_ELECO|nr:hypothetical protein PR202_ga09389 [Eleusine coracana subsp. coracana]
MANPNKLAAAAALLLVAASLAAVLLLCSTDAGVDAAEHVATPWRPSVVAALPFSPMDVLPLLPRRVAMAALRALRGASDIFPVFVGAAKAGGPSAGAPDGGRVEWKGACFYETEAWLEFHNNSGSKYGGGTLHIKVNSPSSSVPSCSFRLLGTNDPLLHCYLEFAFVEKKKDIRN